MTTVSVNPPSRPIRTQAPIVGIHFPTPKDRIADQTANQMKAIENRYFQTPFRGVKKSLNVVTARIVSVPPSQIGFESQYRTELIAAVKRPNASLTQMYAPPSSVNDEPSSDASSAYGMKKKTPRNTSQVNACAPSLETAPSVSSPTSVQIRKKKMSKRPKCFCSFAFSSSAALVV